MSVTQQLKNRIFGKERLNQTVTFIEVMKVAGGYQQVLDMPISAFNQIAKGLEHINKQHNKASKGKK